MLSQQTEKERHSSRQCRLQRSLFSLGGFWCTWPSCPWLLPLPSQPTQLCSCQPMTVQCSSSILFLQPLPAWHYSSLFQESKRGPGSKSRSDEHNSSPSPVYVSLVTRDPLRSRHSHTAHPFCVQSSHSLSVNTIWQLNREISATPKCHIYQKFAALDSQGTYLRYK